MNVPVDIELPAQPVLVHIPCRTENAPPLPRPVMLPEAPCDACKSVCIPAVELVLVVEPQHRFERLPVLWPSEISALSRIGNLDERLRIRREEGLLLQILVAEAGKP